MNAFIAKRCAIFRSDLTLSNSAAGRFMVISQVAYSDLCFNAAQHMVDTPPPRTRKGARPQVANFHHA